MKPYVYIVVRKDINPVNYAPQLCHAALEAGYSFNRPLTTTHLVILQVADKIELDMVALGLEEEGIKFESFYEGFGKMGHTALATEPITKREDGTLRALELFKYVTSEPSEPRIKEIDGTFRLVGLPYLENDPMNFFLSEESAIEYYRSKFS